MPDPLNPLNYGTQPRRPSIRTWFIFVVAVLLTILAVAIYHYATRARAVGPMFET